ncbi:MAG: 4-(cytidine 5'-diphospho)-2-C-methyl-D-erythritol kinase [Candidatus Pelagibacter sp. TMED118]|nr:MAG: 4-(cytidine 5'-diphospho)-2-C-methyl-D-erythritol kinase [Candidatus Pelagibacter sp. TMED118]|tara:strand:+ start:25 stop:867 length:843 start_codon:yes stop_codon:yes gene_type:complete
MVLYKLKSNSKINAHLSITGKTQSKLHKIESIIFFSELSDIIHIKKIKSKKHKINFFGKFAKGIGNNNTIFNLLTILDKKKLLNNQKFQIQIKKNIPQKSGMGGGSMNAASLLKFFINKNYFKMSNNDIIKICSSVGSDVIIGLDNKAKILNSSGNITIINSKFRSFLVIIKPNFGCSTSKIYSNVKKIPKKRIKLSKKINFHKLSKLHNDLEKVAFKKYPKLRVLKKAVEDLHNIEFARMTGSGSTIIGYFSSKKDAINGTKILRKKFKNYWCIFSKTI